MLWSLAPWTHRMREDSFIFLFDVLPTIQSIPQGNNLVLNLDIYHFLPQGETTHHWKQHCQVQSKLLQNGEGKTDHFVTFHAERCDYDWHGNGSLLLRCVSPSWEHGPGLPGAQHSLYLHSSSLSRHHFWMQIMPSNSLHLQSLMTDKPYHNEPGYENERFGGDVKRFAPEWCVPALTDISLIPGTIWSSSTRRYVLGS